MLGAERRLDKGRPTVSTMSDAMVAREPRLPAGSACQQW
jgi:hypothetical protein